MSGLISTLYTAGAALRAHQLGVQTAGANVANATTPGYSARRVTLAATTVGPSALSGVEVVAIGRTDEPFLRAGAIRAGVANGYANTRASTLAQVESALAPVSGSRVQNALDRFFASASGLSSDPSSTAARQTFLADAAATADAFNATSDDVRAETQRVEARITDATGRATQLAKQLADLNQRIGSASLRPDEPSSLLDQRDDVARSLATVLGGEVLADDDGNLNVSALGATVVSGKEALRVMTERNATTGKLDVVVSGYGNERAIVTARATSGELGALVSVRDRDLAAQGQALDALAFDFQTAVNAVHQSGFGLDGVGGRALFTGAASATGAAAALRVNAAIAQTPAAVAASGSATTLPGDNRAALSLLALGSQPAAMSGTATFAAAERNRAVALASTASNANAERDDAEAQRDVADGLLNRTIGVSIDDEMIQLQQFQRAYQASAKVVSLIDEMLDTLVRM